MSWLLQQLCSSSEPAPDSAGCCQLRFPFSCNIPTPLPCQSMSIKQLLSLAAGQQARTTEREKGVEMWDASGERWAVCGGSGSGMKRMNSQRLWTWCHVRVAAKGSQGSSEERWTEDEGRGTWSSPAVVPAGVFKSKRAGHSTKTRPHAEQNALAENTGKFRSQKLV